MQTAPRMLFEGLLSVPAHVASEIQDEALSGAISDAEPAAFEETHLPAATPSAHSAA